MAPRSSEGSLARKSTKAEQIAQAKELVYAGLDTISVILVRWKGEHMKIEEGEKQHLAELWSVCLAPYMPQAGGNRAVLASRKKRG